MTASSARPLAESPLGIRACSWVVTQFHVAPAFSVRCQDMLYTGCQDIRYTSTPVLGAGSPSARRRLPRAAPPPRAAYSRAPGRSREGTYVGSSPAPSSPGVRSAPAARPGHRRRTSVVPHLPACLGCSAASLRSPSDTPTPLAAPDTLAGSADRAPFRQLLDLLPNLFQNHPLQLLPGLPHQTR